MTAESVISLRTVVTTALDGSWEYDVNENRCDHSFRWQLRVWYQWEPWWPQLLMTAESMMSMRTVVTPASDDSWEYDINENRCDPSFWWQLRVWYQWEPLWPQLLMTAESVISMRTVVTTASDDSWEYDVDENRCDPSFWWQLRVWYQWEPLWPQLQMTAESMISMRTVVTTASDDSWEYDINENRCDHSFRWQLRVWYQWEPLWPKLLMTAESVISMRTVVTTASDDGWEYDINENRSDHSFWWQLRVWYQWEPLWPQLLMTAESMISMRTVVTTASDGSWEYDINENRCDQSFWWQLRVWYQWEPLWPQPLMTAESVMSMRTVVTTASDDSWECDINENRCDPSFWWQLRVWYQWEPLWPLLLMTAESMISMRTVLTTASDDSWEYDINENRCDHSFWWQLRVWYQWEPLWPQLQMTAESMISMRTVVTTASDDSWEYDINENRCDHSFRWQLRVWYQWEPLWPQLLMTAESMVPMRTVVTTASDDSWEYDINENRGDHSFWWQLRVWYQWEPLWPQLLMTAESMISMRTVVTTASDDSWEYDINENRGDHSFWWQLRVWCQWEPWWPQLLTKAESVMSMRTVVTTASDDSWECDINENRCDHSLWWQLRVWYRWEPLWPQLLMTAESVISMRTVVTTASDDSWEYDIDENRCDPSFWWQLRVWYQWEPLWPQLLMTAESVISMRTVVTTASDDS